MDSLLCRGATTFTPKMLLDHFQQFDVLTIQANGEEPARLIVTEVESGDFGEEEDTLEAIERIFNRALCAAGKVFERVCYSEGLTIEGKEIQPGCFALFSSRIEFHIVVQNCVRIF